MRRQYPHLEWDAKRSQYFERAFDYGEIGFTPYDYAYHWTSSFID
jgi:hypothetical protein